MPNVPGWCNEGWRDRDLSSSHYSNVRLVTGPAFDIRSSIAVLNITTNGHLGELSLFSFSVGKEGRKGCKRKVFIFNIKKVIHHFLPEESGKTVRSFPK